jgi:hypothetical protein
VRADDPGLRCGEHDSGPGCPAGGWFAEGARAGPDGLSLVTAQSWLRVVALDWASPEDGM